MYLLKYYIENVYCLNGKSSGKEKRLKKNIKFQLTEHAFCVL